jgi:hypothetical protein
VRLLAMAQHSIYYSLVIVAESPDTDIWLGDDDGHFVQKETGTLSTSLVPGTYVVEFGLGSPQYEIELNAESHYKEADFAIRTPSPRRIPRIPE